MRKPCKSLIFLSFLCFSCTDFSVHEYVTVPQFNTLCEYHFYEDDKQCLSKLVEMGEAFNLALDRYDEDSDLYKLNRTNEPIEVDPLLSECLSLCLSYESQFNGYFSYTLGGVKDLYEAAYADKRLPSSDDLASSLSAANATYVTIQGNTVQRIGNGSIDLGGIAKGFFLKKAKAFLEEKELRHYLLNLGHSSILFGRFNGDVDYFEVHEKGYESVRFKAKDISLSTSSVLEQSIEIDGIKYSHIINPKDGSALCKHEVVTLLGDDPCYLDAATTAFMNMDLSSIKAYEMPTIVIDQGEVAYRHGLE